MKKGWILAIGLGLVAVGGVAWHSSRLPTPSASVQPTPSHGIVPGRSVGEVVIGQAIPKPFLARMGTPSGFNDPPHANPIVDGNPAMAPGYCWGGSGDLGDFGTFYLGLVQRDGLYVVERAVVSDPHFKTKEGLGVGSPFEQVRKVFPTGRKSTYEDPEYAEADGSPIRMIDWETPGLLFRIAEKTGKVEGIVLFEPGAKPWP